MIQESLLSDDLLRQLVAVGQVDLLVGLPTLNNASTIPDIVSAVQASFSTHFPRQRTVLLNSDGGSTDDTPAIVRDCCHDETGTVTRVTQLTDGRTASPRRTTACQARRTPSVESSPRRICLPPGPW